MSDGLKRSELQHPNNILIFIIIYFPRGNMCIFISFPRCTGTPVLTFWGKQWSTFMEGVCVTDPPLRMVSTTTCSSMDRSEQIFFTISDFSVLFLECRIIFRHLFLSKSSLYIPVLIMYFTAF